MPARIGLGNPWHARDPRRSCTVVATVEVV
jgi:hypothetical protein